MKKILVNEHPWQTRVAIVTDERLNSIYFSSPTFDHLERTYFKGTVIKVLPGIQTAFVDIGQEKAGFLHISEIDRELAVDRISHTSAVEEGEERSVKRSDLDISNILKEGERILVQVSKEPVYEKGAKLTTCFTLPGRFIVLMPNIPKVGISKKIEDRDERARLKELVQSNLPEGMGAIIRTTSEGHEDKEILKDLNYLVSEWRTIQKNFAAADKVTKVYEDLDLALQVIRDNLDEQVESVIVDDKKAHSQMYKFVKEIAPEFSHKILLYENTQPLFEQYNIEKQIKETLEKKVSLKSGGSLIIETTEAMTVVDVNTGRFVGKTRMEDTIFKTNMEAAEETVRQLRLRNIGGLIVIDFIDMATTANKQKLFRFFEKTLKERDRFQSVVLKISEFGLVQMTRKRSGKTLVQELTETCKCCSGYGFIESLETESYKALRNIKHDLATQKLGAAITIFVHTTVMNHLVNIEYDSMLELEKTFGCKITLASADHFSMNQYKIEKA
jgi:ribonuclease G